MSITYREGEFSGKGELGVPSGKVKGIRSATITASYECERKTNPTLANGHWMEVEEDVGQNSHRARTTVTRNAVAKNTAPDLPFPDPVTETAKHVALRCLPDSQTP